MANYFDINIEAWIDFYGGSSYPKFILDNKDFFSFQTHTDCRESLTSSLFLMLTSLRNFIFYHKLSGIVKHKISFKNTNKYIHPLTEYVLRKSGSIKKGIPDRIEISGRDSFPPRLYSLITFLPHLVINTDYGEFNGENTLKEILLKNCELIGTNQILSAGSNNAADEILTLFALSEFYSRNGIHSSYSTRVPSANVAEFVAREIVNSSEVLEGFISFIKKYNIKSIEKLYDVYTDKRTSLKDTLKEVYKYG